jgi:hypothetical protein
MRTLYLKLTTISELRLHWGESPIQVIPDRIALRSSFLPTHVMIRCNKKGEVNWPKTGIYSFEEIKGRKVVFL